MPYGKGTYGSKVGRPPKKKSRKARLKKELAKVKKSGIKKPKAKKKADTLPPMIIPLPPKPKRKIPKDITKRTPPKRKVPMRKSAVERERRVKFAEENPLMQRNKKRVITGSNIPEHITKRTSKRPALDTSMLLAPLGVGAGLRGAGAKGVKAVRKAAKKPKRNGLGTGAAAALGASAGLGPLGAIGGALAGALSGRPAISKLRKKSKKKRY
jgi:hypothetical protein